METSPVQILRVALYARVSTEEQREGQTIDSQVAELERFATEKGWHIIGIYKDEEMFCQLKRAFDATLCSTIKPIIQ